MPNDLQSDLSRLVARIEREDAPLAAADPYRPYFHFAPPVGWMNDPNGLCRCGEWYHVFYQYGPFDPRGRRQALGALPQPRPSVLGKVPGSALSVRYMGPARRVFRLGAR